MQNKLYRSRDGKIFGVCKGLGTYFNLSVSGIRMIALLLLLFNFIFGFFGIFPIIAAYVVLALIMKPEPAIKPASELEEEFYQSYASSKKLSLSRLKEKFDSLDSRIRRMENHVTDRSYEWDKRFRSGQ